MVVKSGGDQKAAYIVCPLMELVYVVYYIMNGAIDKNMSIVTFMTSVNIVLLILFPVIWRILIFDQYGCTVKLLMFKRTYRWDEMKVKRLESNKKEEWVFFSVKSVNKSKNSDPFSYCIFRHPFTCFYVNLRVEKPDTIFTQATQITECNKEEFLRKMEEWGVKLTED